MKDRDVYECSEKKGFTSHSTYIVVQNGGELYLVNTYYGGSSVQPSFSFLKNYIEVTENMDLSGFKYIGNLEDFAEVNSIQDLYIYEPEDVIVFPVGAHKAEYYVRKEAQYNKNEIAAVLKSAIETLEWKIKSAKAELDALSTIEINSISKEDIEKLLTIYKKNS